MMRDLACAFPALFDTLAEAVRINSHLNDKIYPIPSFTDQGRRTAEEALRQPKLLNLRWERLALASGVSCKALVPRPTCSRDIAMASLRPFVPLAGSPQTNFIGSRAYVAS